MSWSIGGVPVTKEDATAKNGKENRIPPALGRVSGHGPHEADQVDAAWDAACGIIKSGAIDAPHGFVVTLAGHGNPDGAHGSAVDTISVTVQRRSDPKAGR